MGGAIVIRGPLDGDLFRQAAQFALRQHDVQRVRVHASGQEMAQEFVEDAECRFEWMDYSGQRAPFQSAMSWVLADIAEPMCPGQFPLSGDVLFRLGDCLHLWYPKFHHIANDAYGHALVAETVAAGYNGLRDNGRLPELERHSYTGFLREDREYAASARFREDEAFWQRRFARMPEPLPFTLRKGRLADGASKTDRYTLTQNRLVYNALRKRCEQAGVTTFQFLIAMLFAYLHRTTGSDDIVIGTPILNRSNHAFRRTAGMFTNMMPLRIRMAEGTTVMGLARQIAAEVRSCYRHQRFPLMATQQHCRTLDGFCHGIFDVTLIYRKLDYDLQFGGSPARTITLDTKARDETISLEVDEYNEQEGVNFFFNYNPQLICAEEAAVMARSLEALMLDVTAAGDRRVGELRVTDGDGGRLGASRCKTIQRTVLDLFAEHASRRPDAVAVVDGAARVTYGELAAASARVAGHLRNSCGVEPEQPVAVLCDRSAQWISGLFGVMLAGGAYLPLDPEAPRDRIEFILRDSGCRLALVDDRNADRDLPSLRKVLLEDALRAPAPGVLQPVTVGSLAYIIYTSGTTGGPKGVLIEHGGLANTALEQARGWSVSAADGFVQFSAPTFDASLAEIFAALAAGARVVIAPNEVILDPARFVALLSREQVTVAILPPAYLSVLGGASLPSLRLLGTAGEPPNPADVAHYNPTLAYVNAYGPTETSICAAFMKLEAGSGFSGDRVPIGKPLPHTRIYILDANLQRLPAGVAGEICIGGVNVARGYLNRPELTQARFVPSPFEDGERLYRTGDIGRQLPDGNIEFLGRQDTQLKIRGYRVEPDEIEAMLKMHPAVQTAAVEGVGDGLAAYIVQRTDVSASELRRFLAMKFPSYMIPSHWVRMPALPINASGKVDRSALPPPLAAPDEPAELPGTATEKAVAAIWAEVLSIGPISRTADFLELGGHSLTALAVLSRIQSRLRVRVEFREFFGAPTVSQLAALIETRSNLLQPPIPTAAPMELYPLSHAQARIWVLSQLDGGSAAYNMPLAFDLEGDVDRSALERAVRRVLERHESLRTCFVVVDGTPKQKIVPAAEIPFQLLCTECAETQAEHLLREAVAATFDLTRAPLLRAHLFRLSQRRWIFSLVVHHIAGDGRSLEVVLKEIEAFYEGASLPPLRLQYKDYSAWIAGLEERHADAGRKFWVEKLAAPRAVLNLSAGHARPDRLDFSGAIERCQLPRTSKLPAVHTPFTLLLAGVFGLLRLYTNEDDIIIGIPATGRNRLELEDQVGPYLNTLPLRVHVDRGATLAELLNSVRAAVLDAQEHQDYPFDLLVSDLNLERRTDRNPLFDVMVVLDNMGGFRLGDAKGAARDVPVQASVFDLTFHFAEAASEVWLQMEYNTGLFERGRIRRMAGHLDALLATFVSHPECRLDEVDLLASEERERVLRDFAEGPCIALPGNTVLDLFAEQAARTPERAAVVFEHDRLTYRDVATAASALAARIEDRVTPLPGSVIALIANRSPHIVAGVLGIMASGAACLPVDASLPPERIRYLLVDSGCQAVVSDGVVDVGGALQEIRLCESSSRPVRPLTGRVSGTDVAYLAYTSGSTGLPKASLIEHRSLLNLVLALGEPLYDRLPQPTSELLLTSIGFDVALKQIFGALTRGGSVTIAGTVLRRDPKALMAALVAQRIHLLDITPSHFAALLAQGFAQMPKPDLRAIVLGSEPLPCRLVEAFTKEQVNRHISLFNFYGPSECTVEATFCRLSETTLEESGIAAIGHPLANARAYILSLALKPAGIGVAGEICIGGAPVGGGYLNRPELTAAKFVDDPFRPGERIYRTGDLGRWREDGTLEFLGREDGQLKVRGHRIEPGEIEQHLLRHPLITGAVAAGRLSPSGGTELVVWYTAAEPSPPPDAVRSHLRRFLPDSMLPARLVELTALPLHVNGKIDKDALPDPWMDQGSTPRQDPAGDALEAELQAIWRDVLRIGNPGRDLNFFDAGGNSLLLVRLHSLIELRYPGKLRLIELFEIATIRQQAALLRGPAPAARSIEHLVRLGGSGTRAVFCFAPGSGDCLCYRGLQGKLPGWEVFGLNFIEAALPASEMADLLLSVQPDGECLLLGYSSGGNMAYETALELESRGHSVRGLVLIDSWRRLRALELPDAEYRKNAEEYLAATASIGSAPAEREAAIRRFELFDRYLNSRREDRAVSCAMRLVRADPPGLDQSAGISQELWRELTSDFRVSAGSGRHMQMLDEPHLAHNAVLIRDIVEELTTCPIT